LIEFIGLTGGQKLGGREAGRPGGWEAGRAGGWKARRLGSWEARRLGSLEVGKLIVFIARLNPLRSFSTKTFNGVKVYWVDWRAEAGRPGGWEDRSS